MDARILVALGASSRRAGNADVHLLRIQVAVRVIGVRGEAERSFAATPTVNGRR